MGIGCVSVIIPYFQRTPGVLRRALASVAAQRTCPLPVQVIVVDDASPVPPHDEIAGIAWPPLMSVQVISRPNGGPGAARNTGLDGAPEETRFVAFLDSDDQWSVDHLARAIGALEQGFDFFFADHLQLDQTIGAFGRAGRIPLDLHPSLPAPPAGLHAYQGDLFDQIMRANVIGTSTVVYDHKRFGAMRFKVDLTRAGEDYLFWMEIARAGARAAFSSEVAAIYGRGVNVYAGAGWGTEGHLQRIHDEIRYRRLTRELFDLDAQQARHIDTELGGLRHAFARGLFHCAAHRKRVDPRLLATHAALDPASFLALPLFAARALFARTGR